MQNDVEVGLVPATTESSGGDKFRLQQPFPFPMCSRSFLSRATRRHTTRFPRWHLPGSAKIDTKVMDLLAPPVSPT